MSVKHFYLITHLKKYLQKEGVAIRETEPYCRTVKKFRLGNFKQVLANKGASLFFAVLLWLLWWLSQ